MRNKTTIIEIGGEVLNQDPDLDTRELQNMINGRLPQRRRVSLNQVKGLLPYIRTRAQELSEYKDHSFTETQILKVLFALGRMEAAYRDIDTTGTLWKVEIPTPAIYNALIMLSEITEGIPVITPEHLTQTLQSWSKHDRKGRRYPTVDRPRRKWSFQARITGKLTPNNFYSSQGGDVSFGVRKLYTVTGQGYDHFNDKSDDDIDRLYRLLLSRRFRWAITTGYYDPASIGLARRKTRTRVRQLRALPLVVRHVVGMGLNQFKQNGSNEVLGFYGVRPEVMARMGDLLKNIGWGRAMSYVDRDTGKAGVKIVLSKAILTQLSLIREIEPIVNNVNLDFLMALLKQQFGVEWFPELTLIQQRVLVTLGDDNAPDFYCT